MDKSITDFKHAYGIIGRSKKIDEIIETIIQISSTDLSVLIFGESGTGKEVIASAIHRSSSRAKKKLISVNCGAIPEGIIESELFGHVKGSFTNAVETRKGYFELADGGTLFLDEIAEMPLSTQVKLLRAIESKEYFPVGGDTSKKVDVRFIAATNKDLQIEVRNRRFRQDLYYRLKAFTLSLPPLRERKVDIEELAFYFLNKFSDTQHNGQFSISSDALSLMTEYPWPGNIRELKNTVETAASLERDFTIHRDTIESLLMRHEDMEERRNLPIPLGMTPDEADRSLIMRGLAELKRDIIELKLMIEQRKEDPHSSKVEVQEIKKIRDLEIEAIVNALSRTGNNKRKSAVLLGISERTLYRKIKEYDIPQ